MRSINVLPPGVRLDAWPSVAAPPIPQDPPEVVRLKEELRRTMPELARQLDSLAILQQIRDLAGRLAGPQPAQLTTRRS
jgi:hypothetical protein